MKNRIALVTLGAAAALAGAGATTATAQEFQGVYLGGSATRYQLDSDRFAGHADDGSNNVGAVLGYRLPDSPVALELGYEWDAGEADMDAWRFATYYYFARRDGWAPFVDVSFSQFDFADGADLDDDDKTTEQLGFGIGISRTWEDQWEFRAGAKLFAFGGDNSYSDLGFNLGLNYYFERGAEPAPVVEAAPPPKPAPQPPETRTITVELRVLFDFDKAEVKAIYGDELAAVAEAMKRHPDIVLVLEGHTDAIGTEAYNLDLSRRRVEAVKAKLVSDYGIDPARIETEAYGESRPVADNATPEGRAQNRRVVGRITFEEVVQD
ncbi:MAG: hypothetical protein KatS3mg124_0560 [Porticoccaceae bacterium]|nr:MAG: hypothetical protein KatS3mg124_0560 [Porticoccaceae bacterium]